MSFQGPLNDLLEKVPSALGAILADWEGEAVDQAGRIDLYQLKVVGAHNGVILTQFREAMKRFDAGGIEEIVITTEGRTILILPITEEYFLVLLLQREDMPGRVLYEARRCLQRLKEEIV